MQRQYTETVVSVLLTTVWLCQLKLANVHHVTLHQTARPIYKWPHPSRAAAAVGRYKTKLFQRLFSVTLLHNVQTHIL